MSDDVTQVLPTCPQCGLALLDEDDSCPRCAAEVDGTMDLSDAPVASSYRAGPARLADDRYEVLETIGRGGVGIVYKVRDLELDEVIALKVLASDDADSGAVERFKAELKIARRINHPNVARLYDLFPWRGRLAISQEYIEGRDLDDVLGAEPLPIERIVYYLRYICSALDAAHDMGVVHRDLKPGNIRVDQRGRPHILDFGLATVVSNIAAEQGDWIMGTPAYMAPELAMAPEKVDCRADIYSLGVMLFRMSTGTLPFSGTATELIYAHANAVPPHPQLVHGDVSIKLADVILRCLEKEADRRFDRANDVYGRARMALPPELIQHDMGSMPPVKVDLNKRGKVLVIDDDPGDRMMMCALLRILETVTVEAADGYRGVEAAMREKPNLIILDLVMPVLDGRETLRILKSNAKTSSIPVVILTSVQDEEEELLAKEQGAAFYFNKPVKAEILELLIERYLGNSASPS